MPSSTTCARSTRKPGSSGASSLAPLRWTSKIRSHLRQRKSGNAGARRARPARTSQGIHRKLYRFSPDDYRDIEKVWTGTHPDDGSEVEVVDGPPEGASGTMPLREVTEEFAPAYEPDEIQEIAQRLRDGAGVRPS